MSAKRKNKLKRKNKRNGGIKNYTSKKAKVVKTISMENIFLRFPHLSEAIFDNMDNQSLFTCMNVSRIWHQYLENQKFIFIRSMAKFVKDNNGPFNNEGAEKSWDRIIKKCNFETIVELKGALNQHLKSEDSWLYYDFGPLHIVAHVGNTLLYRKIMRFSEDINPKNGRPGMTPLHMAAFNGHIEICKIIIDKIVDKNPKDNSDWTPLHKAAGNGHVEVCKLILEKVEDKNPHALNGRTPLHVAAGEGHFEVIKNFHFKDNFHDRTTFLLVCFL